MSHLPPPGAPGFHLVTLGTPALVEHGSPIQLRKKDLALLVYLRLEGRHGHSRGALAGLLWGNSREENARHSLTQAIGRLRARLGGVLEVGHDRVGCRATLPCDAAALQQATTAPRVDEEVLALCGGEFLAGFAPGPGAEAFETWADGRRAHLRAVAVTALDRLGADAEERGAWHTALAAAQRATELDPASEPAHRRVMRAWNAQGHRVRALQHYDRLAAWLAAEFETDPEPETALLAEQLRSRAAPPPAPRPEPEPQPALATPWPRHAEPEPVAPRPACQEPQEVTSRLRHVETEPVAPCFRHVELEPDAVWPACEEPEADVSFLCHAEPEDALCPVCQEPEPAGSCPACEEPEVIACPVCQEPQLVAPRRPRPSPRVEPPALWNAPLPARGRVHWAWGGLVGIAVLLAVLWNSGALLGVGRAQGFGEGEPPPALHPPLAPAGSPVVWLGDWLRTDGRWIYYRYELWMPGACDHSTRAVGNWGPDEWTVGNTVHCMDDAWLALDVERLGERVSIAPETTYCINFLYITGNTSHYGQHGPRGAPGLDAIRVVAPDGSYNIGFAVVREGPGKRRVQLTNAYRGPRC
ncbi:AfsR/SARP family transcriptional regulator [Longimicrobium sp.]|uniref:AfsR/SARP family transcriptional regulator n=1 Tax=Longimicrobium sp. TaxID=2029185 RepID=UPI003B3BA0AD